MTDKPLVAILGCGPAGLIAAQACATKGIPFAIFSRKQKSRLGGAQYSHIRIPFEYEPEAEDAKLTYIVHGDAETYQAKVYGANRVPFVSFGNVHDGKIVPAWSLTGIYDRLWAMYEDRITDVPLDPIRVAKLVDGFDIVFSSIHLPRICWGVMDMSTPHQFTSQPVNIYNDALDPNLPDNTIVYDGTDEHSYYRMSRIFGVGSTEWGGSSPMPPGISTVTVQKPITTNCDCYMYADGNRTSFVKIGRFGTWSKGELTMHAYNRVLDTLAEIGAIHE